MGSQLALARHLATQGAVRRGIVRAAGLVAAGVVSGADQASISSDRSDYAPGDTVALSGSGWQAGEAVEILVDDDQTIRGPTRPSSQRPPTARCPTPSTSPTSQESFRSPPPAPPEPQTRRSPSLLQLRLLRRRREHRPSTATRRSTRPARRSPDRHGLAGRRHRPLRCGRRRGRRVGPRRRRHRRADGTITDTFDLPDDLAAEFTATATDPADRSATATFETVSDGLGPATEPHLVRFAAGNSTETQAQILAAVGAEDTSYIAPLRIHGVLLPAARVSSPRSTRSARTRA